MIGKYEIRGRLGAGAMGTVLDALDPVIERRAALKIIPKPAADDAEGQESLARFKREAQAAGRLNHPNIVAVYDYGEDADRAWIAMELVEGGTLKQLLDRGERMPVSETLRVMGQMLAGLDYSHKRGVVHRDIKPANLMLTNEGQVKIADFGIARIENSSMTQVGTVMGTPAYMAPEQLRGEPVDLRADIWASGVLLYQLLTGEKPFEGGYASVLHKALNSEPTPPSALSVTAPRGFDGVIAKAMAKRPEDRFQTASAFATAIEAAAGAAVAPPPASDATVVAAPPRAVPPAPALPSAPAVIPARKGPPVALIGGGVALLVAAGVGFLMLGGSPAPPEPPSGAPVTAAVTPRPGPPTAAAPSLTPLPAAPVPTLPAPTVPATPSPPAVVPSAGPAAPGSSGAGSPSVAPPAVAPPAGTASPMPAPPAATPAPIIPPVAAPIIPAPTAPRPGPAAPVRVDFRAAAQAAAQAPACGLIATASTLGGLTLEGVLRRGDDAALRRALDERAVPPGAVRLSVQGFDGPYCTAFDLLRPVLAPAGLAPRVAVEGRTPLLAGDLLRFDVTMPDWPSNLYVAYFMKSGEVAHLVPSATHPAGATVRLGEPRAGFPGWEVSEPFGTDLLVAMVSEGPLFGASRPLVESQEAYLAALTEALRTARQAGRRVLVRPVVIETAVK